MNTYRALANILKRACARPKGLGPWTLILARLNMLLRTLQMFVFSTHVFINHPNLFIMVY